MLDTMDFRFLGKYKLQMTESVAMYLFYPAFSSWRCFLPLDRSIKSWSVMKSDVGGVLGFPLFPSQKRRLWR